MKILCTAVVFLGLIPITAGAKTKDLSVKDLQQGFMSMQNDIKEIRRDQLNYQIEKNMMKEMYSTHMQGVNTTITYILGIFGLLGFFGLRDISSLQKSYKRELETLLKLRLEVESSLSNVKQDQGDAKKSFDDLISDLKNQANKVRLLEIINTAKTYHSNNEHVNVVEACAIGLEIDPENIQLLNMDGFSKLKLKQYVEAIKSFQKIVKIVPDNLMATVNLCELYGLVGDTKRFFAIWAKIRKYIDQRKDIVDIAYFDAFEQYLGRNINDLKSHKKIYYEF